MAVLPDTYYLRQADRGIQTHNNVLQHGSSYKTAKQNIVFIKNYVLNVSFQFNVQIKFFFFSKIPFFRFVSISHRVPS